MVRLAGSRRGLLHAFPGASCREFSVRLVPPVNYRKRLEKYPGMFVSYARQFRMNMTRAYLGKSATVWG